MTFVEALKSKAPEITLHRKEDLIEREIAEVVALHLYSQGQITRDIKVPGELYETNKKSLYAARPV